MTATYICIYVDKLYLNLNALWEICSEVRMYVHIHTCMYVMSQIEQNNDQQTGTSDAW